MVSLALGVRFVFCCGVVRGCGGKRARNLLSLIASMVSRQNHVGGVYPLANPVRENEAMRDSSLTRHIVMSVANNGKFQHTPSATAYIPVRIRRGGHTPCCHLLNALSHPSVLERQ